MADNPEKPERTTSFAKTLDKAALARARSLKQEFDRAQAGRDKSAEKTRATDQARHAPAPGQVPRPKTPEANLQDRRTFNDRQAQLDRLAKAKVDNEQLKARTEQQKMLDQERDKDRDK